MSLVLVDPRIEPLALARATGEAVDEAVVNALRTRLDAVHAERPRRQIDVSDIQARVAALPVLDGRSADELLGYDEYGLPT